MYENESRIYWTWYHGKTDGKELIECRCRTYGIRPEQRGSCRCCGSRSKEASYAEIGEQCERIIIMVPSGAISKSILFDEDGVASTIKEGTVVCDMSSVTPVESKECYEGLKAKV